MIAPIVSADWLRHHRDEVSLCDVRSYLDGRDGPAAHLAGHLSGAVFIDMDTVLAGPPGPIVGRHPLPSPEAFARGLGAAGIGPESTVVVYDDLGGMVAGRLVWMLRILGQDAALLDGGIGAWDGPIETGPVPTAPVDCPVRPWPVDAVVDADAVVDHVDAGGLLVDSRAPERYRGEVEPIDLRAGHVPGAVNLPFAGNLGPDGCFLPPDELRERFAAAGVTTDTVFYCGSGASACHNLLAVESAGLGLPRLYVASWSGWSSDPDRPA